MEWHLNLSIETGVKNYPMTDCPVCIMPLHKGDDMFMSDKQFAEFYWPTYQRLLLAMINEGMSRCRSRKASTPAVSNRSQDTPPSSVVWWFDQTDMKEAKRLLGKISCIVGNVPTSTMITGTAEQVTEKMQETHRRLRPRRRLYLGGGASMRPRQVREL